ncbi:hypothetical protein E6P09_18575 (plasmid) [Haloferax mediterranei ATCC 33500]|uniref:Lipoprotein n=2 Tax=Haloferax mediterranei (strain ATCC 33500 / DSM 1411 / JCM 8866 / NBRC 14739 / NCIMB 2177 / R-4) TaxID=523841 RepID=I3R9H6_HALMT|nr:hypothetical protein [Haloferax mediterranei]AFK20886.1 hypothetical protein HFX_5049 [Haloferax mediterranei ATCC 33500]AHZ24245.1 hypothetical protein BM92_18760 [Haloferax mediterranei ATCC 33500]MDX5989874.1 hypothetical protein [Haloferax mediterranei ATCC 33500]QCQ77315.1 hypothetical protein E6P09_18575 [Haloferax mediterranei ATCC 33500]
MSSTKVPVVLAVLVLLSGCSALSPDAGPRYDVSTESVTVNGSQSRVIAITPPADGTLPKGGEVTVDGGYVTFTETATMNYNETAYLVYVPSRTKFELTPTLDGTVHGLDDANFTVDEVRISAHGTTESHEL